MKLTYKTINDDADFEYIRAQMPEDARTNSALFTWAAEQQEQELRYLQKRPTSAQVAEAKDFKFRVDYKENLDKLRDSMQAFITSF